MGSERKQILAVMISVLMYNICFGVQTGLVLLVLTGNAGKKSNVKSISLGLYVLLLNISCAFICSVIKF